jgi:diacylglycerol O-acyltransferase / wax synthase
VLAMCSGALRSYLAELGSLPSQPLVAMVPVSLRRSEAEDAAWEEGGNAIGTLMVSLETHREDPADRLAAIHSSVTSGRAAMATLSQPQILAMSALGMSGLVPPLLGLPSVGGPPFNLVISNVPGPRQPLYLNGAKLTDVYPLSIPTHGLAMNITCTSYEGMMNFGLTGCRRSLPHLQRVLGHLDDELERLEEAAGVG